MRRAVALVIAALALSCAAPAYAARTVAVDAANAVHAFVVGSDGALYHAPPRDVLRAPRRLGTGAGAGRRGPRRDRLTGRRRARRGRHGLRAARRRVVRARTGGHRRGRLTRPGPEPGRAARALLPRRGRQALDGAGDRDGLERRRVARRRAGRRPRRRRGRERRRARGRARDRTAPCSTSPAAPGRPPRPSVTGDPAIVRVPSAGLAAFARRADGALVRSSEDAGVFKAGVALAADADRRHAGGRHRRPRPRPRVRARHRRHAAGVDRVRLDVARRHAHRRSGRDPRPAPGSCT